MRILFEVLLLAVVSGAVFLFYRAIMKKIDGEKKGGGEKGFTLIELLIELLILISIFVIIAAIAIPGLQKYKDGKKLGVKKHMVQSGRNIVVDFRCPKCSHELSVNSKEE